jgi:hypothetical protein
MTITTEELQRLVDNAQGIGTDHRLVYLARRVLAAEKMVEAGSKMADAAEIGDITSDEVTAWDAAISAYEATK